MCSALKITVVDLLPIIPAPGDGKRVSARKRGLAVDVLCLIIAVVVTAVSVTDNTCGHPAVGQARPGKLWRSRIVDQPSALLSAAPPGRYGVVMLV